MSQVTALDERIFTGDFAEPQRRRRPKRTLKELGAHKDGWEAASEDGKRALAILDEVQKDYKVDTTRVYLTGISMGGEGTWSLATPTKAWLGRRVS